MQAIWKGHVTFGLVSIPVSLITATSSRRVSFKMLHAKDNSPVSYKKFCEKENREIPKEEIVKGFEIEEDRFVVLNDEDFDKAEPTLTKTINIISFARMDEIDPMWYDRPYYLEPREGGLTPYELLRRTLVETDYVGICKTVLRNREYLCALTPRREIMVLELLHYSDEVRSTDKLEKTTDVKVEGRQLDMAKELVSKMAETFDYKRYKDEYNEKLMDIIRKKAAGKKIVAPKRKKVPEVENLMEALEKSLKAA